MISFRSFFILLALFNAPSAEARSVLDEFAEKVQALNHCEKDSDCVDTRIDLTLMCPTLCNGVGVLIHKDEKAAFEKLKAAQPLHPCPAAKCARTLKPTDCPITCVRSKCELDRKRSKKGC